MGVAEVMRNNISVMNITDILALAIKAKDDATAHPEIALTQNTAAQIPTDLAAAQAREAEYQGTITAIVPRQAANLAAIDDGDLPGRTAEADEAKLQPEAKGFTKGGMLAGWFEHAAERLSANSFDWTQIFCVTVRWMRHLTRMTKRSISKRWAAFLAVGLVALLGLAYYHHCSTPPARATITSVSSLKQIGLSFRGGHNDIVSFALSRDLPASQSTDTKLEQ